MVSVGLLWSNVLIFRLSGFPVTVTTLLVLGLWGYGIFDWLRPGLERHRLLLPASTILLYEFVIHGVAYQAIGNAEWVRSFALLSMSAGLIVVSSRLVISEMQLNRLATIVSWTALLMGGLGLAQFLLANIFGFILIPLPASLAVGGATVETDALRFAGLYRSRGISSEFSYYGVGMVVLTTLCVTFYFLVPPIRKRKTFRRFALLLALSGVLTSVSFTAIGMLFAVLLSYIAIIPRMAARHRNVLFAGLLVIAATLMLIAPFLQGRFSRVLANQDNAALYRISAPLALFVTPADNFAASLVGTGVGLDSRSRAVENNFAQFFSPEQIAQLVDGRAGLVLVNGWAYLLITMGWLGILLNSWLIWTVFQGKKKPSFLGLPLLVLLLSYFFGVGSYLSPEWWAMVTLVAVLRGVRTSR